MRPQVMRTYCGISASCHGLLKHAMDDPHLSARAHDRTLKVSRTIADLAGAETIGEEDLLEALQYRSLDRSVWL